MKLVTMCAISAMITLSSETNLRGLQSQADFCKSWDPSKNNQCTQCYYHYWLNNGTCQPVSDQCATWDLKTGACTSCFYHSYVEDGICKPIADSCATWDASNGKCTSCWTGATLQQDGSCKWSL